MGVFSSTSNWFVLPLVVLLTPIIPVARAEQPTPTPGRNASTEADRNFFEKHVRPILIRRCGRCHGKESRGRGGLRTHSRASLLRGGDRGPALVPGKPERSLLIQVLRHDGDVKMPPRTKLPRQEIAILTTWVRKGAPWPGSPTGVVKQPAGSEEPTFTPTQRQFWAFRPPTRATIPTVKDRQWVQTPLDAFILAQLEAKGLRPAARASRRTLIRRVTFDLTGLPPTPEEIQAFLNDHSPDAFARVVDRLLTSPAYGERWGRHWLDVARYADSNGMDENLVQANAWRYRDYVIDAFNEDRPYDQFVHEQLAGDLLPAHENTARHIIATGFLALGPKMLAEDDPVKMQMDIIDEQMDMTGRVFMGLTLGCARCHDHKFDPIPTADYYSLAGIFKSTQTMDNFKVVARWHERPVAPPEVATRIKQHEQHLKARQQEITCIRRIAGERLQRQARSQVHRYVLAARELLRHEALLRRLKPIMAGPAGTRKIGGIVVEAEAYQRGNVIRARTGYGAKIGVIYNQGKLPNVAEYDLHLKKSGWYRLEIRYAAAQARPVHLYLNGQLLKTDSAAKVTGGWYPKHQRWAVEAILNLHAGKNTIRLECAGPFPHFDKLAFLPHKTPPGTRLPRSAQELARAHELNLVFLRQWARYLQRAGRDVDVMQTARDPAGPFALSDDLERAYPNELQIKLKHLRQQLAKLEKARPQLPRAMAVEEGKVTNVRIHLRGSHLNLGKEVPRQFPRILAGSKQTPIDHRQSGRLQLAHWLTREDHPLTARVMVNRIWHWHFGQGLVSTPDNFGMLGARPTNQPLLDWLSMRFIANGWSIKALHRLIVLSGTYQMSTAANPLAFRIDPDNTLHWRWNRRRLQAEEVRDALLAVSGKLDQTMGGTLMVGKNRKYVPGYPNTSYNRYQSQRRSVYLPIIRSNLYDVFQAFDFADPSTSNGTRATTTVAPQALFWMNGKLVHEQTRYLAQDLLTRKNLDSTARLNLLYARAYGRTPTTHETTRALDYLHQANQLLARTNPDIQARQLLAWQSLCRVLLSANEFMYVE